LTSTLKDSNDRQEFPSGAVRDTQTLKGRFDLLPHVAVLRCAQILEMGAEKYAERNWEKGMPVSRCLNSGIRHALKAANGFTDEPHLALAAVNFLFAIEIAERAAIGVVSPDFLDIPSTLEDVDPSQFEGEIATYTEKGVRHPFSEDELAEAALVAEETSTDA